MEDSELKSKSKLKDITKKTESFLQGKNDTLSLSIPKNQSAYLHYKAKQKVWGNGDKDA